MDLWSLGANMYFRVFRQKIGSAHDNFAYWNAILEIGTNTQISKIAPPTLEKKISKVERAIFAILILEIFKFLLYRMGYFQHSFAELNFFGFWILDFATIERRSCGLLCQRLIRLRVYLVLRKQLQIRKKSGPLSLKTLQY